MSPEMSPGSSFSKSTRASSGSTRVTSMALTGRRKGLSGSLALMRGVVGVLERE